MIKMKGIMSLESICCWEAADFAQMDLFLPVQRLHVVVHIPVQVTITQHLGFLLATLQQN